MSADYPKPNPDDLYEEDRCVPSSRTMKAMSGRTKGETLPASSHELERLKNQAENRTPVVRHHATPANAHVVPSRRANSAHSVVPPPPDGDGDGDGDHDEVVIEMSGDDDDDPGPRRSRSDTLADPMTTEKLRESARAAPPPPAPVGPNRHVKRR